MRPFSRRLFATGGVVGVKGNIAPDGVIVNVGAMVNLQFSGPARCFDGEEACFESAMAP
jgi:dihydroxy-acid dehydratase